MKTLVCCLFFAVSMTTFGQIANENSFLAQVDGKEYKTQPRRIQIGNYWWVTANTLKPDQSIRIWLGSANRIDGIEPGTYLIVDADKPDTKNNWKRAQEVGGYKGIAVIKYVGEIREPRMEYHVGKSQNKNETITVKMGSDGFLEGTFEVELIGTYWKEKASATVFGGMGRLMSKMEDKAVTKTTGYDSGIDPEGNGYKKQDKIDKIVLKNGQFRLKLN